MPEGMDATEDAASRRRSRARGALTVARRPTRSLPLRSRRARPSHPSRRAWSDPRASSSAWSCPERPRRAPESSRPPARSRAARGPRPTRRARRCGAARRCPGGAGGWCRSRAAAGPGPCRSDRPVRRACHRERRGGTGTAGLLDEAEAFAVLGTAAARLARGAEALGCAAAATACLILVAEARVLAGGHALEALGHDLALVDPDLDADPAVRRLRLGEAVVDVRADRVQRDAALGVALRAAHLAAAEAAAALDLDPLGARAHRGR